MKIFTSATLFVLAGALTLTGCSGGGGGGSSGGGGLTYTGATSPVTITAGNAQPIGETSTEAARQVVYDSTGASANPFGAVITDATSSTTQSKIDQIGIDILKHSQANQTPAGVVLSADQLNNEMGETIFCGGSANISDALYNSTTSGSGTVTFSKLCMDLGSNGGGKFTLNGSMTISYKDDGVSAGFEKITYTNFTVTQTNKVLATLNGSESCTWEAGYANESCTSSAYYAGSDNKTYKIENANVSGNDTSGWDVDATFYHPDYGSVTVRASGLKFGCSNHHPSAGTIDISGANGTSINVAFLDCDTYSGSYNAGSAGSASFSGW